MGWCPFLRTLHTSRILLGFLLSVICGLLSCGGEVASYIVVASGIPAGAESLQVRVQLDDVRANELPLFPLREQPPGADYSFALRLPTAAPDQRLLLLLEALDPEGCLIGTGSAENRIGIHGAAASKVKIPMQPFSPRECGAGRPILRSISPDELTTAGTDLTGKPAQLVLQGWGFAPSTRVIVDGQGASGVQIRSAYEIHVDTVLRHSGLGEVAVEVITPEGTARGRLKIRSYGSLSYSGVSVTQSGLYSLQARDVNRDGFPDLLAFVKVGPARRLFTYLGDGRGGILRDPVISLPDQNSIDLLIGDMTGDGVSDALYICTAITGSGQRSHTLVIQPGDGRGRFGPAQPPIPLPLVADSISGAAVGDLDGDGRADLVLAAKAGSGASAFILSNQAPAMFSVVTRALPQAPEDLPFSVGVNLGDIDGDGFLDVSVYPHTYLLNRRGAWAIATTDAWIDQDLDGHADLTLEGVFYPGKGDITVYGTVPNSGRQYRRAGDVNGDGLADFVSSSVILNPGIPFLAPVQTIPLPLPIEKCAGTGSYVELFLPMDLNRDGKDDLLYMNGCTYQLAWFLNKSQ